MARGLAPSDARARALIMAGAVRVGPRGAGGRTRRVDKPGTRVPADAVVTIARDEEPFVSRGGRKLAAALDVFGIDPRGRIVLDVGASTGGFTDCLLRRGAARIFAVDVGYGQLAWALRIDPRVVVFERTNIRHLAPEALPALADLVVIDVSFISLRIVLAAVRRLCRPAAPVVALVKPQFEVAKGKVGKGGVVREPALRHDAVVTVAAAAAVLGYAVLGEVESPVPGTKGNVEIFLRLGAPDRADS